MKGRKLSMVQRACPTLPARGEERNLSLLPHGKQMGNKEALELNHEMG